ncbi:glycosyltransferase [Desulfovibrio piger]|nr:glycosyltransferase [Desulfovibrio piger]
MFDIRLNQDFPCSCDDGFFIPKETKLPLWGIVPRIDLSSINLNDNRELEQPIIFVGNFVVKIGVLRDGFSYTWIYEKNLKSDVIQETTLSISFKGIEDGKVEVMLYANEDSAIFYNIEQCVAVNGVDERDIICNIISPSIDFCSEVPLYYKICGDNSFYSFEKKNVQIAPFDTLDLTTYFNSFSACKWKKYTTIENIKIYFDFQGEALVYIIHFTENNKVLCKNIILKSDKRSQFLTSNIQIPATGLLGIQIKALKHSIFWGGAYLSTDNKTQDIYLGIGITTYKREHSVIEAVKRLSSAINAHKIYKDKISIAVVDNGKTLSASDISGATLIPNENLGGTGGFMRNLIHYKNLSTTTHCLFMDDDASCEPESIFRSIAILEHAKKRTLAISGAMLSEKLQFMQWENGAWFDDCCHPMHCHYDMTNLDLLIKNEFEDNKYPTYGAWWFFMFPISAVKEYSFPFFVRGDDVEFSYKNNFQIARMNGICTWQEDFSLKSSPMTRYLDTRSAIVLQLTLKHTDSNPLKILHLVWKFFYAPNWSYMYDSANAVVMAFADILNGPKYWIENMDTKSIREMFKEKYNIEMNKQLRDCYLDIPDASENNRFRFCTKFIRRITLNGHLLPSVLLKQRLQKLSKYQIPFINRVFLRSQILVYNKYDKTEFILNRRTGYFIKNIIFWGVTGIKFILRYKKLKKEYKQFLSSLKTDDFWQNVFQR